MNYQRLNSVLNEIRLLSIIPSVSSDDTVSPAPLLQCKLETVSLYDVLPAHRTAEGKADAQSSLKTWSQDSYDGNMTDEVRDDQHRFQWGDFEALSYTWGDPSITRPIYLNSTLMNVTRNLEAALRKFS